MDPFRDSRAGMSSPLVRFLLAGAAVLALLVLSFVPVHSTPALRSSSSAALAGSAALPSGLSGSVLWNGVPTTPADSPSSAIATSFGTVVTLGYSWAWLGTAPAGYGITHAQLRVLFLGQSVWTKDLQLEPARNATLGAVNLTSDLTSSQYLLEGVYIVEADLVSDNQGQVWSEQFYVHVQAPNHLTAAGIGLGALAVYEVVQLARVGPHALPKERMTTKVEPEKAPKELP